MLRNPTGLDLSDPWHLPTAQRWAGRQGRRSEWRMWLALDPEDAMTQDAVRAATGIYRDGVQRAFRSMVEAGEVDSVGDGTYRRSLGPSIYDHVLTKVAQFHLLHPLVARRAIDVLALGKAA